MLSFAGRADLKARISSQMHQHIKDAVLGDVIVGEVRLHLYGWKHQTIDYHACELALGIPRDLMRLGVHLTEGFPDSEAGIREVVRLRRALIDATPVGVDLKPLARQFLAWLVLDAEAGPARFVELPSMVDVTLRVADLLTRRPFEAPSPGDVAAALEAATAANADAEARRVAHWNTARALVKTPVALQLRNAEARAHDDVVNAAASLVAAARFASGDVAAITDVVIPLEAHRPDDGFMRKLLEMLACAEPR